MQGKTLTDWDIALHDTTHRLFGPIDLNVGMTRARKHTQLRLVRPKEDALLTRRAEEAWRACYGWCDGEEE